MEQWEAALEDYKAGLKYQDIAKKYDVSLSAVKSWASRKWKQKTRKKVATPRGKKTQPKRNPGAPIGNQNAVGNRGGAPKGNRNNYKHGFFIDALSDEERAMIEERGEISEEQHLINQMALWEIRERHLMQEISNQRATASGLAVQGVTRGKEETMHLTSTLENIKDLEDKLTRAQQGHMRCVMNLSDLRRGNSGAGPQETHSVLDSLSDEDLMSLINKLSNGESNGDK